MLSYKKFCFGNMFSNTYLVWDEDSREAMIVDCGNPADRLEDEVRALGLRVKFVVLTHAHYDHVLYLDEYRSAFSDASILIGRLDLPLLRDPEGNVSYLFGDSRAFAGADGELSEGDTLSLGECIITVLHTPGHTPGCICLYSRESELMLTGDTIFAGGGIGRTDFKYGDFETLMASLKRIRSMNPSVTILPGHGGASKIEYEKRSIFG